MEPGVAKRSSAILKALADLAPSTEPQTAGLVVPTEWFRWLPVESTRIFLSDTRPSMSNNAVETLANRYLDGSEQIHFAVVERQFGERLGAVDQIRAQQRSLRIGWLFVAGSIKGPDGRTHRMFHPLVTIPVRVQRPPGFGNAHLLPAGDAEVSELVTDHDIRHDLESRIHFGGGALDGISDIEIPSTLLPRLERLAHYARAVAAAAGLPATKLVSASDGPDGFLRKSGLVIVAGVGVYATHQATESSRASSLRAWSSGPLDQWTAFHSLYLDSSAIFSANREDDQAVESPYVLTPTQRDAVARSRHEPITLISGAPGTGKSHTLVAIACDALARGERVLVAAKSDATVDALLDLLERAPGPDPIVFGSNERREALAERLSAGQLHSTAKQAVEAAQTLAEEMASKRDGLRKWVAERLAAEIAFDDPNDELSSARDKAPGLFDPGLDLDAVASLVDTVRSPAKGWGSRRRQRSATQALGVLLRASPVPPIEQISTSLAVARGARLSGTLEAEGGLDFGPAWEQLAAAETAARHARGRWLAAESGSPSRLNRSTLPAVAALATALRSGRSARRQQLSRLDNAKLTCALPLWVGTLADVDDLLPFVAGLFDLVVLDEASSIDQPLAATTLLRGRRAVIAGDPRQLRQVSFVSDAQLGTVLTSHGLDEPPSFAARLDVRRNSAFDLAASASPVLVLNEHFRSDPHLIDFVARRLYDGNVLVATRCPRTESRDCVDVVRTEGTRDTAGVVSVEVARAIVELRTLLRTGARSVGIVTPFRAQADALEVAVLRAFSADDLEALDLRVGTVHAFQGNERDVVIASLGIGHGASATTWRFVEDPHLFAVFVTRARRRMTLLVSAEPPTGGLVAAYLAQAHSPPGPPKPAAELGDWAMSIAEDLTHAGVAVRTAYPTGRHVVDIALSDETCNIGIECGVHPDGADAHIDRRLALERTGWRFVEAYRSRWGDRRGELVVNLVAERKR